MSSRRRILVCLLFLLAASVSLAPTAEARSNNMVMNTYFSDDTFSEGVGFQTVLRCGGTSGPVFGLQTEWVYWEQSECITYSRLEYGCKYELRDGYLGPVIVSFPISCPSHLRH